MTILHTISSIAGIEGEHVALLLEAGARYDIKDDREKMSLHYATDPNNIRFLLEKGANLDISDGRSN